MTPPDIPDAADPVAVHLAPARWPAVAFVCNRCGGRKGAPKSLDAKRLGQKLREAFRDAKLRSRIVHTGCMGLCPRGAMVAAISLGGGPLQIAEPRKKREVAEIVRRLAAPSSAPKRADTSIIPITPESDT